MTKTIIYLDRLIKEESWEQITHLDPDDVTSVLEFENSVRLAFVLIQGEDNPNLYRTFAVRLLYSLKENYSEWKKSWKNEAMLADICEWAMRYHESYYAGQRALAIESPISHALALQIGSACEGPSPLMTDPACIKLLEYAITDKPYRGALFRLEEIYESMSDSKARLDQIKSLIDETKNFQIDDRRWLYTYPECAFSPFDFRQPFSRYEVVVERVTKDEIVADCIDANWKRLVSVDPHNIAKSLSFPNGLRIAFRMVEGDERCQRYAVRLLYAIIAEHYNNWFEDWRHTVLLGICCEVAGKYDEQFGAYDNASYNARVVNDGRPINDLSAVPAGLTIALARCALLPDPSVTFEQAIGWLEGVMKQEIYIDALELLLRIYHTIDQTSTASEVEHRLQKARSHGVYSELPLPPCINEEFDEPLIRSE
ncbi:MAG: hypothetical protein Q8K75_06890 [Chlamydiales bacterium]|nr:hypothetical protein [Chlamydiales bacterium]